MNREQYLAKRMWIRGASLESGGFAETRHPADDSQASSPPAQSLSDDYQRLHQGVGQGKRKGEKPN